MKESREEYVTNSRIKRYGEVLVIPGGVPDKIPREIRKAEPGKVILGVSEKSRVISLKNPEKMPNEIPERIPGRNHRKHSERNP